MQTKINGTAQVNIISMSDLQKCHFKNSRN